MPVELAAWLLDCERQQANKVSFGGLNRSLGWKFS